MLKFCVVVSNSSISFWAPDVQTARYVLILECLERETDEGQLWFEGKILHTTNDLREEEWNRVIDDTMGDIVEHVTFDDGEPFDLWDAPDNDENEIDEETARWIEEDIRRELDSRPDDVHMKLVMGEESTEEELNDMQCIAVISVYDGITRASIIKNGEQAKILQQAKAHDVQVLAMYGGSMKQCEYTLQKLGYIGYTVVENGHAYHYVSANKQAMTNVPHWYNLGMESNQ